MKKFLFSSFLVASLASSLFGADLLASLTNGKISDNSPGVKVLSLDEAKQVKGGYYFQRYPSLDQHGLFASYTYAVTSDNDYRRYGATNQGRDELASELGFPAGTLITAKYRYTNGTKQYYLTGYYPNGVTFSPVGYKANKILQEFKSRY